jgi:hypothetical protein
MLLALAFTEDMNHMNDTVFDFHQHIQHLESEGYVIDDERFKYVKGLSRLLMYLHDSIKSLMLTKQTAKYEPEDVANEHLLQQSLLRNAILNYAKCFSESGKGHITLDKKQVFKDVAPLLKIHDEIITLRHKFFAHSDESGLDYVAFATKETDDKIITKQLYTIAVPLDKFEMFQTLFMFTGEHVKVKILKSFENLEKKYGKKILGFGES